MKKYYCPYCGEKVLTANQKFSGKKSIGVAPKSTNKLWFTCSHCQNEVSHISNRVSQKYYKFLIPCIITLAILFLFFTVIKQYSLLLITICMAVAVSLIMCYISYKYDNFVRIGKFEDKLFNIKLNCMKEKYCLEEVIYQIKPLKKDMNKNVQQSYIVAFSEFTEDCKSCKMRFIKPKNGESFISNCKSFEIYDDFTMIGSGELS